MKLKFFWVPVEGGALETDLNLFLGGHKVVHVERHFAADGGKAGWAVCVEYLERVEGGEKAAGDKSGPRVDYREVLDAESFKVYSVLREWRKETAARDGVPVYSVLTNEQMAEVAKGRIATLEALAKVAGLGEARLKKYGEGIMQWQHKLPPPGKEAAS